jgi:hypothetical protein
VGNCDKILTILLDNPKLQLENLIINHFAVSKPCHLPQFTLRSRERHFVKETTVAVSESRKKTKKRNFSSFRYAEAFKQVGLTELLPWPGKFAPVQPSAFFQERLVRLQATFDLQNCEDSKKLLIDAVCEEALYGLSDLKIWKGADLESDTLTGFADYLVASKRAYLEAPFVCVVEAKKDDFDQGLAQCLVEMQACQWCNRQVGKSLDVFGVVTNGEGWKFYQLTIDGIGYGTMLYGIQDVSEVLGALRSIFTRCVAMLETN